MKSLGCVVIGEGRDFTVEIEERKRVGQLKEMIKEQRGLSVLAADLTLYRAKKDGKWLTTADPEVKMLKNGEVPQGILDIVTKKENKMDFTYRIGNAAFNFPDEDDAREDELHVLVVVPGVDLTETSSEKAPPPSRKRRWDQLNTVLVNSKKNVKIEDGDSSMSYPFQEVNEIMPATQYQQPTKAIGDDAIDLLYSYLLVVTKAFGQIVTGMEAKRLHLIAPVLASVCALFDGDAQLFAEENVVGERVHGDGRFEFVIKRGSKRLCIVVAKKEKMEQGLAQAYVGSEVLADVEGISTVYNVVTNYKEWLFSRITDETVERDAATLALPHDIPTRESVKEIAEKIYAMLSDDD